MNPFNAAGEDVWKTLISACFSHWTDMGCTTDAVPWQRALFDRRGFRHGVAFRSEFYLAMRGLSHDGQSRIRRGVLS